MSEEEYKKTAFQFGQYQRQVSLLSGISLEMLKNALEQTGITVEVKEVEEQGLLLNCEINGLTFSLTVIDFDGSFFDKNKLGDNNYVLSTLNEWNADEAFAKTYFTDGIIVLEMIIAAAGVVDDNVNDGIKSWIEICQDFALFLTQREK
jgi:hypothetical protein